MAYLKSICLADFCSDVHEYTAGDGITIENDVISAIATDLSNYYNKQEVDSLISGLTNARIEVVQTLPAEGETNVIYLVPKAGTTPDVYDEYVWITGGEDVVLYNTTNWDGRTNIEYDDSSVYTDYMDKVRVEITGLTYDGLTTPIDVTEVVDVVSDATITVGDTTIQFSEWVENNYVVISIYESGQMVTGASIATLKLTKLGAGSWEKIGDTDIDLSNYYTKTQTDGLLNAKQNTLTAGQNIQIAQDGTISATDTTYENATQSAAGLMSAADKTKLDSMTPEDYLTCATLDGCQTFSDLVDEVDGKQDALTAGANIQIAQDGTISATDTVYTAGANVQISANNEISATDTTYTAGQNVTITNGEISATDTTYTAGDNITITNGAISATFTKAELLSILGYEDVTISKTDSNNQTVTLHVLGYVEE